MEPIVLGAKTGKLAGELLKSSGALSDLWQVLLGDRVSHWRVRNAARMQHKTTAEVERLGLKLNPSRLPDKFVVAWFDEALNQDEDELQTLFARLLIRAADDSSTTEADRRLIEILARFTPVDAVIFQRLYSDRPFPDAGAYSDTRGIGHESERDWPEDWLMALLEECHPGVAKKAVEQLILTGCLRWTSPVSVQGHGAAMKVPEFLNIGYAVGQIVKQRAHIGSTELGTALFAAVKA